MNEGVKIVAEKLLADPSMLVEGVVIHPWVQLATLIEENYKDIFTQEEIDHIREAKKEAVRLEFTGMVLDVMNADDPHSVHIPLTKAQHKRRLEQAEEQRRMYEMEQASRYSQQRGMLSNAATNWGR